MGSWLVRMPCPSLLRQLHAQHFTAGIPPAAGVGLLYLRLLQHLLAVRVSNSGRRTGVTSLTWFHMKPRKAKDVPLLSSSNACGVHPGVDPYTSPLHFAVYAHPSGFTRAWIRPSDTDQVGEQALTACSLLLHLLAYR